MNRLGQNICRAHKLVATSSANWITLFLSTVLGITNVRKWVCGSRVQKTSSFHSLTVGLFL